MLRKWQSECVEQALKLYLSGHTHFQIQATPGSGKTITAATIAKKLFDLDKIDLVLCFSPSLTIAEGTQRTFEWQFDCSFNGGLGSVGATFTYQCMKHIKTSFWETIKKYRLFVVFDEVHHCAGNDIENSNVWGEQILSKIHDIAQYTLSLSGTPWRSDAQPITLAKYSDNEQCILCDYQYSLKQSIEDRVCRSPKIVLVDNERLSITESSEHKSFFSISELLKRSSVPYKNIIQHDEACIYILGLACKKLSQIRTDNPNAGGLVVASSVAHAVAIQKMLNETFQQSTAIVTYQHENAVETINHFRHDTTQWIVSVGMISEGTDIPRLQVCCHLSSIKTELYFRQVLGRILRTNEFLNQEAWLFTFAEENLVQFAEQVEKDIPDSCLYINAQRQKDSSEYSNSENRMSSNELDRLNLKMNGEESSFDWGKESLDKKVRTLSTNEYSHKKLDVGSFHERVIEAFL
ncbi:DEAD/DEAH box helicase [Vibrio hibernica]|uniref:DEAD/DEAH box helicase n=1 Tax=Vibrio hibernica TaxID=2587465 RepID=UPI0039AFDB4C